MRLDRFAMERLQSTWENRVAWNLSESGVHPLRLEDLADTEADRLGLFGQELGYPQTNGTGELRQAISAMYPGTTVEHIQVTNGGAEANCISLCHLVQPGDDVIAMVPNYMQAPGLARGLGANVRPWALAGGEAEGRWYPDLHSLESMVTDKTRVILVCNPNNPTGARFTSRELDAICGTAARVGAWVLSDEIYRGAELDGEETASAWGRYERVLITSGLSKAYGLPGLRIGWVVGPPDTIEQLWAVHDYTTIAPGALNDRLARIALTPDRRERLLARTRGMIRANYPLVRKWIERRASALSHVPPEAGAIVFVRYDYPVNSTALIDRLREEQSVLVVPGDHFDMDGYLRIGFGSDPAHLARALERVGETLDALANAR